MPAGFGESTCSLGRWGFSRGLSTVIAGDAREDKRVLFVGEALLHLPFDGRREPG
jgi:hypothetical protein